MSYRSSNQRSSLYHASLRRPPLRAKAVPMPRPHDTIVKAARLWLPLTCAASAIYAALSYFFVR